MCGHFAINYMKFKSLIDRYGLEIMPIEEIESIFNDAHYYPSHGDSHTLVPVVLETPQGRKLDYFRWDIVPAWWNKPLKEKKFSSFNARSESLMEKATFKSAWQKRKRCIIPATGFFEWPDKKLASKDAERVEYRISLANQNIFSIAAIWEQCMLPGNEILKSCTIITVDANEKMLQIPHTRMPAILTPEAENAWLSSTTTAEAAAELLRQYPAEEMIIAAHY